MQHSPKDQHTHDMLDFFLNLIVGPELAPQVRVPSSLPVLYKKGNSLSLSYEGRNISAIPIKCRIIPIRTLYTVYLGVNAL